MDLPAEEFTEEEREILKEHFSNYDKPVFVIITPKQVDRGSLMSRYSRTDKSMRRVFLDEFAKNPNRGEEFYDRVLLEYGDESVAELGQVHLACEGISQIAAKFIEDGRIGRSYLEKSTRYVPYDKKVNGQYKYLREPSIMASPFADKFVEACDFAFDVYSKSIEPLKKFLKDSFPIAHPDFRFFDSQKKMDVPFSEISNDADREKAQKIYESSIRPKALDTLRGLLPAGTLTNVGISATGRSAEYLLAQMASSNLAEIQNLYKMISEEVGLSMKPFIKRIHSEHGKQLQEYIRNTNEEIRNLTKQIFEQAGQLTPIEFEGVKLVDFDDNDKAEKKVVSAILYRNSGRSLQEIKSVVENMEEVGRSYVIDSYVKHREHKTHRPGRAFENVYYTFDCMTNFGIFRDLHRHRILTMERQILSTNHGFDMPSEIIQAGLDKEFSEVMYKAAEVYEALAGAGMKEQAQYVVPLASYYPYYMMMNLREATHMIELRTSPQGHPDYRRACQSMYEQIKSVHPVLGSTIKFVDMNDYHLGRFKAEKRKSEKMDELDKK